MSWKDRLNKSSAFEFLTDDEVALLKEKANAYYGSANYENFHERGSGATLVIDAPSDGLYTRQIALYGDGVIVVDAEYDVGGYCGSDFYTPETKEAFDDTLDELFERYLEGY